MQGSVCGGGGGEGVVVRSVGPSCSQDTGIGPPPTTHSSWSRGMLLKALRKSSAAATAALLLLQS